MQGDGPQEESPNDASPLSSDSRLKRGKAGSSQQLRRKSVDGITKKGAGQATLTPIHSPHAKPLLHHTEQFASACVSMHLAGHAFPCTAFPAAMLCEPSKCHICACMIMPCHAIACR